jgi:hypothetical protein
VSLAPRKLVLLLALLSLGVASTRGFEPLLAPRGLPLPRKNALLLGGPAIGGKKGFEAPLPLNFGNPSLRPEQLCKKIALPFFLFSHGRNLTNKTNQVERRHRRRRLPPPSWQPGSVPLATSGKTVSGLGSSNRKTNDCNFLSWFFPPFPFS